MLIFKKLILRVGTITLLFITPDCAQHKQVMANESLEESVHQSQYEKNLRRNYGRNSKTNFSF